jgi:hypothetical protein
MKRTEPVKIASEEGSKGMSEQADYECPEEGCDGILTVSSSGKFVTGKCSRGHEVEYELPEEALQEPIEEQVLKGDAAAWEQMETHTHERLAHTNDSEPEGGD